MTPQRREELIHQLCDAMGWDYSYSPIWTILRSTAKGDAVAIGLDKLEQLVNLLGNRNPKGIRAMNEFSIEELTERFYQVREQRNKLLWACESLINWDDNTRSLDIPQEIMDKIKAAYAEVKAT